MRFKNIFTIVVSNLRENAVSINNFKKPKYIFFNFLSSKGVYPYIYKKSKFRKFKNLSHQIILKVS